MPLTWLQAKETLSQYAGRGGVCPTGQGVDLFVRKVLEYLLLSGEYGNLRKFCFNAVKGCFTVPYELEVPLKIKIDGEVATAWDRWFDYYSSRELGEGCVPIGEAAIEDPNYYPTVYDLPPGGAAVGVLGSCAEDKESHVIVQGVDTLGREVFTQHKGEQVSGEYLSIIKNELRYTRTSFSKITGILKDKTNGYVTLFWVKPNQNAKGYLSTYTPLEEAPSYRRYQITSRKCPNVLKVSVLGRIRLKPAYADTDFIPFDTLYTLELAAQAINANYNNDAQTAVAKDAQMEKMITKANEYKRVQSGQPIEVFRGTSPGLIKNII